MGRKAFHFDNVAPPFAGPPAPPKRRTYRSPLVNRLNTKKGNNNTAAYTTNQSPSGNNHPADRRESTTPIEDPIAAPGLPLPSEMTPAQLRELDELKDQICQHSYSLRQKLFKLANEAPTIQRTQFVDNVEKTLKLSPQQTQLLQSLLNEHGQIEKMVSFSDFEHSLKREDRDTHEGQYAVEAHRFMRAGIMDRKLQKVVERSAADDETNKVLLATTREKNQLGQSCIQPPFAVMGDSERMAGIISAYLEAREDTLKEAMLQYADAGGNIAYADFQKALLKYDKCTSQNEMDDLMTVLDPRRKGFFSIDKFLSAYGQEYIKKRSQRSTGGNPFAWSTPVEYDKEKLLEELRKKKRQPKRMAGPRPTKTSNTRKALMHSNSGPPLQVGLLGPPQTVQVLNSPQSLQQQLGNSNTSSLAAKPPTVPKGFTSQSARVKQPTHQYKPKPPPQRDVRNIGVATTSSLGAPSEREEVGSTSVNMHRPTSAGTASVMSLTAQPAVYSTHPSQPTRGSFPTSPRMTPPDTP